MPVFYLAQGLSMSTIQSLWVLMGKLGWGHRQIVPKHHNYDCFEFGHAKAAARLELLYIKQALVLH